MPGNKQTNKKSTTGRASQTRAVTKAPVKKPAAKNTRSTNTRAAASKKSTQKPSTRAASQKQNERRNDPERMLHQLLPGIICIAAAFLLLCYIISHLTGVVGVFMKNLTFGFFAGAAWLIPFLMAYVGIFWRRDLARGTLKYKIIFSVACLSLVSVLIQAFSRRGEEALAETFNVVELFKAGCDSVGGGLVGGLIGNLLLRGFGFAGTLILGIALILLFGIFLFGMTPHMFAEYIIAGIREWRSGMSSRAADAQLERERRLADYEARRAEQLAARADAAAARASQAASRAQNASRAADAARGTIPQNRRHATVNDALTEEYEEPRTERTRREPEPAPVTRPEPQPQPEPVIDAAVFDEVLQREQEKQARMSGMADEPPAPSDDDAPPFDVDEPAGTLVESDAPPFEAGELPKKDAKNDVKLSFFRREKVKPLPPTPSRELEQLEAEETRIDLAKIFTEPELSAPDAEPGMPDEEDIVTSAEIDLMVEKSRLSPEPILAEPDDDEDEEDEPMQEPVMTTPAPAKKPEQPEYVFPPLSLLKFDTHTESADLSGEIRQTAEKLVETLRSFNVKTKIINVSRGPTITRYELQPEIGTKVRSIVNLVDDIALHLATGGVRIEAPIPGKEAVGIEVPNRTTATVYIRELLENDAFKSAGSRVTTGLGMDVAGNPVFLDIAKMPHLLIAGTTGSGKSVCINSLIISMLYKARPDEVKFIMIDPKKVELNVYNGIPHLLVPVVSDPKKAAGSLHWAVTEMERRYDLIEGAGVRNIKGYNQSIANDPDAERLPQIVIIIDELADLMMMARDDVEESICRIAQKARAAGMHLVLGTQRPTVDVVTGLIKANVPSRIAFTTMSQMDSRTIIDTIGAEKLIGRGDMLYAPIGSVKPTRVQGCFVSDEEVEEVTTFIKNNYGVRDYDHAVMETIEREAQLCGNKKATVSGDGDIEGNDGDPMLKPAIQLAVESGKISTSLIQRRLQLGYGRAAKLIDAMEQMGIVSPPQGQKPRDVLISKQEYMEMELRRED